MKNSRIVRNIRLGIKNLLLHKLRSVLTTLGLVFGVGSVVAMLAVGEGASKEALEQSNDQKQPGSGDGSGSPGEGSMGWEHHPVG